jgi:ubiquitin-like protein Pup
MQTKKVTRPNTTHTAEEEPTPVEDTDLLTLVDEWLDEIDEALGDEVNFAQEFWSSWVQKGGE